ncbi:MAG: SAM-dependent chlorinase/fluorinase, partial [Thermoplasmatota archaeon]
SGYVAQMKGVLYSRYPDVYCVDISHDVAAHNVKEGAFLLRSVVPHFPRGTIHVAVVDPGVGTPRRGIVVATRRHVFIGPDNGLLMPAARLFGDFAAYEITNKDLFKKPVSDTFHGRDIFTPIAAHILNGLPFEQIGPRIQDVIDISFQQPSILDNMIMGAVLYVDRFGNIVTNISSNQMQRMAHSGDELTLQMNDQRKKIPFVNTYGAVEKKGLLALIGSSGFLEISVNQGDASELLQASMNDTFQIQVVKPESLPFE